MDRVCFGNVENTNNQLMMQVSLTLLVSWDDVGQTHLAFPVFLVLVVRVQLAVLQLTDCL